ERVTVVIVVGGDVREQSRIGRQIDRVVWRNCFRIAARRNNVSLQIMNGWQAERPGCSGESKIWSGAGSREREIESLLVGGLRKGQGRENSESAAHNCFGQNLPGEAHARTESLIVLVINRRRVQHHAAEQSLVRKEIPTV